MGKPTTYLSDEDEGDFFSADDFDGSDSGEPETTTTRKREHKVPNRHAARQRLDSRKEELWLKQQLNDWGDELEEDERVG
jgi:hypothetical protein